MAGKAWQEASKSHFTCTQGAERKKLGSGARLRVFLKLRTSSSKTLPPKGSMTSSRSAIGEVGPSGQKHE